MNPELNGWANECDYHHVTEPCEFCMEACPYHEQFEPCGECVEEAAELRWEEETIYRSVV